MKKTPKFTITYLKCGKEITKTIHFFNRLKIWNKILSSFPANKKYIFHDKIEYLHLKNVIFPKLDCISFKLDGNQILILENCTFHSKNIDFENGNIEILNPNILSNKCFITVESSEYVNITLSKKEVNNQTLNFYLNSTDVVLDTNFQKKINFINIESENIRLRNINSNKLQRFTLYAEEEIKFEGKNHIKIESFKNSYIRANKLDLGNTQLEVTFPHAKSEICIVSPIITGEDYLLKSSGRILINDNIYPKKENEENILLTPKDLSLESQLETRRHLISTLKGFKSILEKNELYKIIQDLEKQPIKKALSPKSKIKLRSQK